MTTDTAWKFIPLLVPIAGSIIQVWTTLLKRSNWIRRAQSSLGDMGWPLLVFDRLPLWFAFSALVATISVCAFGLMGGGMIVASWPPSIPPSLQMYARLIFESSFWVAFAYIILAVLVHTNMVPRLILFASGFIGRFYGGFGFHPGLINASRHVTQEDEAVPINTINSECESVASQVVEAWAKAGVVDYQQHRAVKPEGFSAQSLANFLLISNAIESAIHQLPRSEQVQFGPLYKALGQIPEATYSPERLRQVKQSNQSFYTILREQIEGLPDKPLIDQTVKGVANRIAAFPYWGSALNLAKRTILPGFSAYLLDRRLRRINGFANSQAMRAQVVKLGIDMGVWPTMRPGPFRYPYAAKLAQLLLNLQCIRTLPDIVTLTGDEDFMRLCAWTMDRIVDAVESLLLTSTDDRVIKFCQTAFASEPREVDRWKLCREVDYFLWFQTRAATAGGIFGDSASGPWKVEGNSFTKE